MKKNIHIGSLVRRIRKEKGISCKKLANALCCSVSNIYSIYKRDVIDYDLLLLISEVLEYDFLSLCYALRRNQGSYIIVLETNKSRREELSIDDSVKILKVINLQEMVINLKFEND